MVFTVWQPNSSNMVTGSVFGNLYELKKQTQTQTQTQTLPLQLDGVDSVTRLRAKTYFNFSQLYCCSDCLLELVLKKMYWIRSAAWFSVNNRSPWMKGATDSCHFTAKTSLSNLCHSCLAKRLQPIVNHCKVYYWREKWRQSKYKRREHPSGASCLHLTTFQSVFPVVQGLAQLMLYSGAPLN